MSTYSVRLVAAAISPTFTSLYTAPASNTIVVRDIELYNNGTSSDRAVITVGVSGFGNVYLIGTDQVPLGESVQWEGRVVLRPGDTLGGFTVANFWTVLISGYELAD